MISSKGPQTCNLHKSILGIISTSKTFNVMRLFLTRNISEQQVILHERRQLLHNAYFFLKCPLIIFYLVLLELYPNRNEIEFYCMIIHWHVWLRDGRQWIIAINTTPTEKGSRPDRKERYISLQTLISFTLICDIGRALVPSNCEVWSKIISPGHKTDTLKLHNRHS